MSSPFPALRPPPPPLNSWRTSTATAPALQPFFSALLPPSTVQWPIPSRFPKRALHGILQYTNIRGTVPMSMSSAASGECDGPWKWTTDKMMHVHKAFDELPQPVKSFPWSRVLWSFQNIILELLLAVAKYLSLPLLAITSLSEMSYCAHERKMVLIPIPFFFGFALAGFLKDAAVEFLDDHKEDRFPWHLLLIASFFMLLKLLGPYYPYWGRLLVPHFANGALWRTVWFTYLWCRRRISASGVMMKSS